MDCRKAMLNETIIFLGISSCFSKLYEFVGFKRKADNSVKLIKNFTIFNANALAT